MFVWYDEGATGMDDSTCINRSTILFRFLKYVPYLRKSITLPRGSYYSPFSKGTESSLKKAM